MSRVIWITASPRDPETGAAGTVRLAGGGRHAPYRRDGHQFRAGVAELPRFQARLGFDENGWNGSTAPTTGFLPFRPPEKALLSELGGLYWKDAAILVEAGPEGGPWTTVVQATVAGHSVDEDGLQLEIGDLSVALDKPVVTDRFAGTGGAEGGSEAAGRVKRRSWGRVFNIEGRILDKANNIYEFGDPARAWAQWDALRDKGRAGSFAVLAWQGSVEATLTALKASAPAQGGGVVAPSIACAKWWTQPAGPLTADIRGEIGAGYVETVPELAARLVAEAAGPAVANAAAMAAVRPDAAGIHIGDTSETTAAALDRLLLGVSMLWTLDPAGTIHLREWSFANPVESLRSISISRKQVLPPTKTRRVAYQASQRLHGDGEIAAALLLNRGEWELGATYMAGEFVTDTGGSSWSAKVGHVATAENAPPELPATSNATWSLLAAGAATDLEPVPGTGRAVDILGNSIVSADGNQGATVQGSALGPTAFAAMRVTPGFAAVGLAASEGVYVAGSPDLNLAYYNGSTGALSVFIGNAPVHAANVGLRTGELLLAYDRTHFRVFIGGEEVHAVAAAGDQGPFYPRWVAYEAGVTYSGLRAGLFSDNDFDSLGGPNLPEPKADVTQTLEVASRQRVAYDWTGTTPQDGQLPRTLTNTRKRGGLNASGSTTWTFTPSGCSITSLANGQVQLDGVTADGAYILVASVRDGKTLTGTIPVDRVLGEQPPAPPPSGTPITSFQSDVSGTLTETVYDSTPHVIASGEMDANASGQVRLVANVTVNCHVEGGSGYASMKWRRSSDGGTTWVDTGVSTTSSPGFGGYWTGGGGPGGDLDPNMEYNPPSSGSAQINALATGMTAGARYKFQLIAIKAGSNITVTGSASGGQS